MKNSIDPMPLSFSLSVSHSLTLTLSFSPPEQITQLFDSPLLAEKKENTQARTRRLQRAKAHWRAVRAQGRASN